MTMTAIEPQTARNERGIIQACLKRIQQRLWAVRFAERLALALAWAAVVALPLTGSRLLREQYPKCAALLAALGLAAAVALWVKCRQLGRGILTINLVKLTAILTAGVTVAAIALALIVPNALLPLWTIPAGVALIFVAAAALSVRMIDTRAAAIFVDQQADLEERVSTALELLEQPARDSALEQAFQGPVVESALAACQQVKLARVGYERLDRRVYALAAVLAIGSAAMLAIPALVPIPPKAHSSHNEIVVNNAKSLAEKLKEIEKAKLPNDQATAEKIKPLQSALEKLLKGDMGNQDATAALEIARQEMRQDQEKMEASDSATDKMKTLPALKDLANAEAQLKDAKAAEAAGDAGAAAKQQEALKAMQAAADALGGQMKSGDGGMNDSQKGDLANGLKDAAGQAGADPQLQRDLERAAGAAQKGDGSSLSQNLEAAGERMAQQQSDHQLSQDAVNQAMKDIDQAAGSGASAMEQQANGGGNSPQSQNGGGSQSQDGNQNGGQNNAQNGGQNNGGQPKDGGQPGGSQAQANGGSKPGEGQGAGGSPNGQMEGSGSTNMDQKGGPGGEHAGTPVGRDTTYVKMYDQDHINSQGNTEKVSGIRSNGPGAGKIDVKGPGDMLPSNIKPYEDMLPAARQRVIDDLSKQEIPPQYQDMVRAFYTPAEKTPAAPTPQGN